MSVRSHLPRLILLAGVALVAPALLRSDEEPPDIQMHIDMSTGKATCQGVCIPIFGAWCC